MYFFIFLLIFFGCYYCNPPTLFLFLNSDCAHTQHQQKASDPNLQAPPPAAGKPQTLEEIVSRDDPLVLYSDFEKIGQGYVKKIMC